ncbi:MAG TPA: hypothetical protein VGQ83_40265 [Polyangia bacterium]|jgi:phenylacetate-CoA ligase
MGQLVPRIRDHVDCVSYIQQGIDGRPRPWYFVVDADTGYRAPVSPEEAEVIMAMRRLNRESSIEHVTREVRVNSGLALGESAVRELVAHLERLGLTGAETSAEAIRHTQLQGRREAYQAHQLAALNTCLQRMADEVPYYQELFAGRPEPARSLADLARFPVLTKALLRANFHRLQPAWFTQEPCAVRFLSSSGTTETRTQTVHLVDELSRGYAIGFSVLNLNPGADSFRIAYLTPPVCSGTACHMDMRLPYEQRLMPNGRLLLLNSFRDPSTVPPEALEAILHELLAFGPTVLAGDAAYLAALARFLLASGRRCPSVKAVVTSYGVSSALHLHVIAQAFECPIHDLYSATETGPVAGTCAAGRYHVLEPCHVEVVDDAGPVGPGQLGKVLVTTLHNKLTPLLRYETGDLARAATGPCGCGWAHSEVLLALEGRVQDLITDSRGQPITPRAVDRVIAQEPAGLPVQYYGLLQRAATSYVLVVVPGAGYGAATERTLRARAHELLGRAIDLAIEPRGSLPPAPNGKYRLCYRQHLGL